MGIDEEEIIKQAALERPQKLATELEKVVASLRRIKDAAKSTEQALKGEQSTSRVTKQTENLRKAQRQLSQEQDKAAKIAKVLWLSENEVAESMKRAAGETKKTGDVVSELDRKQASAANSATALAKSEELSARSATNAQKAYKAESGSLQELIQRRIQLQNANKNQNKNQEEDADLLKKGIITRQELNKRMTESESVIAKNRASIQTLNQAIKTHMLTVGSVGGEYRKLTATLESARTKYKDMAASGTATTKALKDQQKIVTDLDKKVRTIDQAVGQFQRNVGNYPATFAAATQAVTRFLGAFGLVTGLMLFAKAIKDIVAATTEFEYKNDTLQAVLGETEQGIKKLTDQQIKYGEATVYSALQVADLQIIYSKMGLTTQQIENATEATLDLATATGEDLAKSADVVGTIMQSFGINAEEARRIVDVMAASFNKTTLGIDNFSEAMKYVAPIAKANNVSLEETTALLGVLADSGIRGSMAGTSLRKIISDLDKGSGSLSDKLKSLAAKGFDSADAMDEVGRTAYAALITLTQNIDKTEDLNVALQDVNGTARETAAIMGDNLKSDFALLGNATESLQISIGEGLNDSLRTVVQSLTAFVLWLKMLPKFLKDNRGLIIALGIALLGFNANAIKAALSTLGYELALKRLIIQERLAAISTKTLTAAIAANPIGAILVALGALVGLVTYYDKVSSRAEEVEKRRGAVNKTLASTTELVSKAQQDLNISTDEWLKMSEAQRQSHAEQIQAMVNLTKARLLQIKAQRAQLAETAKELTLWQQLKAGFMLRFSPNQTGLTIAQDQMNNAAEATEGLDAQITQLEADIDGLNHVMDKNNQALDDNKKKVKELAAEDQKLAMERKKAQYDLEKFRLEQQIKTLEEIKDNENNSAEVRLKAEQQLEQARAGVAKIERAKALLEEIKDGKVKEKNQAQLLLIEEKYQAALTEITKNGNKDRGTINRQDVEKSIKDSKAVTEQITKNLLNEYQARANEETAAIQRQVKRGVITREEGDKLIIKSQRAAAKEMLEISIETLTKQLDSERNLYFKARERQIQESTMSEVDKEAALLELKRDSAKEQADILEELNKLQSDLNDNLYESEEARFDKLIMKISRVQRAYEDFSQAITALSNSIADRRIADIDREEKAQMEFFDRQIFAAGDNEKAQARIEKEREKRQKEFERRRTQENRRAAKFEKAQALVSAAISGALAVLNALSTVKPYPAAVVAAVSAGILAGVQVAAIAAAPLPQYAEGVAMGVHPGGLAIVGEEGTERMRTPGGRISFTPDHATLMDVPRGTEITTHDQTMRDLAMDGLMRGINSDRRPDPTSQAMLGEMKAMRKEMKNMKPPKNDIVKKVGMIMEAQGERDGQIDYVRSLAMGKYKKPRR